MRPKTLSDFVAIASKVHNHKYDYSLVEFVRTSHHVNIICQKHGSFRQIAKYHLKGSGCTKCKHEQVTNIHTAFKRTGTVTLYFMVLSKGSEVFQKIGITAAGIDSRVHNIPYNINAIYFYKSKDYRLIREAEIQLHSYFAMNRYSPKDFFGGASVETYKFDSIDEALETVNETMQALGISIAN